MAQAKGKQTQTDIAASVAEFLVRLDSERYADLEENGLSRAAVGHWISGRNPPTLDQFFALCAAVGADPGQILFGQPVMPEYAKAAPATSKALRSTAAKTPGLAVQAQKARSFRQKRRRLRRVIVTSA